jgi:3-O-methylgallate 3,4-dioxygenase
MAEIVLGVVASHSPQVSSPADVWGAHAERDHNNKQLLGVDGEFHTFDELKAQGERVAVAELTEDVWTDKYDRCQAAIERTKELITEANADLIVMVGDDQRELFLDDCIPAFAVYTGGEATDLPASEEKLKVPGLKESMWAWHGDEREDYNVHGEFGDYLAGELTLAEFDVAQVKQQNPERSLGHAFTFVWRRMMADHSTPIVPVLINTFVPPNQPTPARCYAFGKALRRAIEAWDGGGIERVAVVASGGLSHFVVDEELDQAVIAALQSKDEAAIAKIPRNKMRSGSSEILNWVATAGAVEHLEMSLIEYVPAYRTAVGTGVGMGFASWA